MRDLLLRFEHDRTHFDVVATYTERVDKDASWKIRMLFTAFMGFTRFTFQALIMIMVLISMTDPSTANKARE